MYSREMMKSDEFLAALKTMLRDHSASPLTWSVIEIFLDNAKMKRDKIAQRITSGGMNRHEELRRLINLALY